MSGPAGNFADQPALDPAVHLVEDPRRVTRLVAARVPPRLVRGRALQVWELGDPAADVLAGGVELPALGDRVEHPEVRRGVGACAGNPLPAMVVRGDVAVDQVVEEVPRPDGSIKIFSRGTSGSCAITRSA